MAPMYLLTVVLATLSVAYCDDHKDVSYPIFPKCNPDTLNRIRRFHRIAGTPKDVLAKGSNRGSYITLATSFNFSPNNITCVYFDLAANGVKSTFVTNGITDYVLSYAAKERDGVIRGWRLQNDLPEYRINLYTILHDCDMLVYYVCSNFEGVPNVLPTATIHVTEEGARKAKNNKDGINQRIASMECLLKQWCFNLDQKYGLECSGKKPNECSGIIY